MKKHIFALILAGAIILLTGCPDTEINNEKNNSMEDENLQQIEPSVPESDVNSNNNADVQSNPINTNEIIDESAATVPVEHEDEKDTDLNTESYQPLIPQDEPDDVITPEDEPYEWVEPDEITYDNTEDEHIFEDEPIPNPATEPIIPLPMPEMSDPTCDAKPVIYLYPEETMEISVKLDYNGTFTTTYPKYIDGWKVTAEPDGTITYNGREYYCIFWEGISNVNYALDKGFCVKGEDTEKFLEDSLKKLGLTDKEANEFIIYWLPKMENNAYNIISFQEELYTDNAKLTVSPEPDTLIRVFMTWKGSDVFVEIEPQELSASERKGFTVIEWGGSEIS